MSDTTPIAVKSCRYGTRCRKNGCKFDHSKDVGLCRFDNNCTAMPGNCSLFHTVGFCPRALTCPNPSDCGLRHPPKKSTICMHHVFSHPEGYSLSDICPYANTCKYGESCKYPLHVSHTEMIENGWLDNLIDPPCGGWQGKIIDRKPKVCEYWHPVDAYHLSGACFGLEI